MDIVLSLLTAVGFVAVILIWSWVIMKMFELKKFDAVLRMSRFSTKRKGCDKKRLSKKACRGKVIV